jgi:hypothetical protein
MRNENEDEDDYMSEGEDAEGYSYEGAASEDEDRSQMLEIVERNQVILDPHDLEQIRPN